MRVFASVGAGLLLAAVAFSSAQAQDDLQTVRVVVRTDSKNAATPLTADGLRVTMNGREAPVQGIRPLMQSSRSPVEVAILIDDGLRGNFGNQIKDIRTFVEGISASGASVAIGYMQNGRVLFAENAFSSDPDTVAKNLRLPLSGAGISGSPYFCLEDAVKHWPSRSGAPRVVLMITNGLDLYNGPPVPQNQNSPYVQQAIQDAQRAGVPVYSIYYGRFDYHPGVGSFSGQSYLGQVADETGAETFNQGSINPPSIAPYLQQFDRDLRESYVLTFQTAPKKDLQQLKLKSSTGVKLRVQRFAGGR